MSHDFELKPEGEQGYLLRADQNRLMRLKERSPLNTRAWALHKRLPAKRTLSYTADEMRWECGEGFKCEYRRADNNRETSKQKLTLGVTALRPAWEEQGISPWELLVEQFTSLGLTFDTDRLPALSGLAQRHSLVKQSQYVADYRALFCGRLRGRKATNKMNSTLSTQQNTAVRRGLELVPEHL